MRGLPHEINGEGLYVYVAFKGGFKPAEKLTKKLVQHIRTAIEPIAPPDKLQSVTVLPLKYPLTRGDLMDKFHLNARETLLVIIDIQERLAAAMAEKDRVVANALHLIELAKLHHIPILLTEQFPRGLGPTLKEIKESLPAYEPFEKVSFNCCREEGFPTLLAAAGRKKVLLTGMETHICILQTALGLLEEGYDVHVIQDAVCSRTTNNFQVGIEFLRDAGAVITTTETVLFQILERAGSPEFKVLSKRIK